MKVNPSDPEPAAPDVVIVIFGAAVRPDGGPSQTLRDRVDAGVRFGAGFVRPLFIPTGAKGRYGDAEATVMARRLMAAGFPGEAIHEEKTGTDTLSSVRAVAHMVCGRSPVYACTNGYHLPRCLVLLWIAGIRARACPPPPVPEGADRWRRWYWRLREVPALPYDVLLMMWLRVVGRV
ncbi:YdcF family protein [Acidisphaera sp. S103]|uniref:YdcF family protein n=1 Tax=Acidisphaera sp. S103 TaxID=1747223 RepID=UPI00131E5167|nr:YdcF family protein [Acidisphaera sp. S103]